MLTQTIGVREFTTNFNKFKDIDIVEIVDKKTNDLKGIYLSKEQALEFQKYLKEKKEKQKQERLNKIMKYIGSMEVDDKFKNLSDEELKIAVAKEKAGIIDE